MKLQTALVALGALALLGLHVTPAIAAETEVGSIWGLVKAADGKPLQGLSIRLEQDLPLGMPPGGKSKAGGKQQRIRVVGKALTDAAGHFEFKDLAPGTYRLVSGNKSMGWIYLDIEVVAGQETKLDDLRLTQVK